MALIALFARVARSTSRSTFGHGDHRMSATKRGRRQRLTCQGYVRRATWSDPDYLPFFIDRAEDAAPASPQAAQIRRPVGNDSGGCGSSASWLTASPGAATPTESWQAAKQCARLRDVASIRLASGAAWAVAGVRLLSWLVRNMTITAIPTSAKVNAPSLVGKAGRVGRVHADQDGPGHEHASGTSSAIAHDGWHLGAPVLIQWKRPRDRPHHVERALSGLWSQAPSPDDGSAR